MKKINAKRQVWSLVALLMLTVLAGCRSTRNADNEVSRMKKQQYEQLVKLAEPQRSLTDITARTTVKLSYNGRAMTVKGKLKMRRDETVQMTFTALGLMEVACVEFTPTAAYIVDRVGKRYTRVDYSGGMLKSVGADFSTIQALFWNRLFIPGKKKVWEVPEDFTVTSAGAQQCVEPARQRMLKCYFYTDEECKQLQQTRLELNHYEGIWQYDMFEPLGSNNFPSTFSVSLSGSSRTIGANVALSSISYTDTTWKSGIDLSRYKEVELEELMSILNILK